MDTNQQACALMMRHHQVVKNRQQSLLERSAEEIGMDVTGCNYNGTIQGKPHSSFRVTYDRSHVSLS